MSIGLIARSDADRIAVALEGVWRTLPLPDSDNSTSSYHFTLVNANDDDEQLVLARYDSRYVVTVKYSDTLSPHRNWDSGEEPHISVSVDRSPEMLAREIERRLLPDYRAAIAKVRVRKTRNDARTGRHIVAISRLQLAGNPFPSRIIRNNEVWYYTPRVRDIERPDTSMVAEFSEKGTHEQPIPVVKLSLRDVPLDLAEQIVKQIMAILPRERRVFLCPRCHSQHELATKTLADKPAHTVYCADCYRSLCVTYAAATDTLEVREFTDKELGEMWVEGGGDLYTCQGCGHVRLEHEITSCYGCYKLHQSDVYCLDGCFTRHLAKSGHDASYDE